jgi:adenylate kinase
MNVDNYILLGPPGSGKSTQAELLRESLNLEHIDIGKALRSIAEENNALGRSVHEIINIKKELVSDGIIKEVLEHVLRTKSEEKGVLIDGAPRRISQVDEVLETLKEYRHEASRVIFLFVSLETAIERISGRMLCLDCKIPYKKGRDKEVESGHCSVCGGAIGQRADDTVEGITKRYEVFMNETKPVIDWFRVKGLLLEANAEDAPESIAHFVISHLS